MVDKTKQTGSVNKWLSEAGEFERPPSAFRHTISTAEDAEFPPERGRYHLYVAYSCPWAHRTLILRQLRGLESVISFTAMHWHQDEKGWRFATISEQDVAINMTPDPHHPGFTHLQDIFLQSDPNHRGRVTTPTLYDTKSCRIVNNESSDIMRMLNHSFDVLLSNETRGHNVYPDSRQSEINSANEWIYTGINNGVYSAGFATSQIAYESAALDVFSALSRAETHVRNLSGAGPFFFGGCITETDIRLFVSLIRFDPVYVQHFKLNVADIRTGFPALHRWMRWLYWTEPAFKDTTRFDHIKWNYTKSQLHVNPSGVTPLGPIPNILALDDGFEQEKGVINREEFQECPRRSL